MSASRLPAVSATSKVPAQCVSIQRFKGSTGEVLASEMKLGKGLESVLKCTGASGLRLSSRVAKRLI